MSIASLSLFFILSHLIHLQFPSPVFPDLKDADQVTFLSSPIRVFYLSQFEPVGTEQLSSNPSRFMYNTRFSTSKLHSLLPASCYFLAWLTFQPWKCRWHAPQWCRLIFIILHGSISSKKISHNYCCENLNSYIFTPVIWFRL
jgi:hypothetical protein